MKKLLFVLPLLTLGFAGSISNHSFVSVKADNEDRFIYIDISLNSEFLKDNSNPSIIYGENSVNLSFVKNGIYKTEEKMSLDILNNNFVISCFDNSYHTDAINLKDKNYDYICLDTYIEESNCLIKGYGYYAEKATNPGATYATQRVWLYSDIDNNQVGYSSNDNFNIVAMDSIVNSSDGKRYFYADIPAEIVSIHFLSMNGYVANFDYNVASISYGSCYFKREMDVYTSNVYGASASLLAAVTEAYLTYGDLYSNGSKNSTVKNIYSTWFANKVATSSELKSTKIKDYTGYAANGNSYVDLSKNAEFSVNEKWNTMCSQAGIDPNTGNARSAFTFLSNDILKIALIAVGSIAFIGLVIAFFVYKHKKDNR